MTRHEKIWNEAQMFASDLLAGDWRNVSWFNVPLEVRMQFINLISEDVPRSAYTTTTEAGG